MVQTARKRSHGPEKRTTVHSSMLRHVRLAAPKRNITLLEAGPWREHTHKPALAVPDPATVEFRLSESCCLTVGAGRLDDTCQNTVPYIYLADTKPSSPILLSGFLNHEGFQPSIHQRQVRQVPDPSNHLVRPDKSQCSLAGINSISMMRPS